MSPAEPAIRSGRPSNPFASRHVSPESVAYVFAEGESAASLGDELEQAGWTGELIGPHGVGKSALLFALIAEARRRGRKALLWQCRSDASRLPWNWRWLLRGADVVALNGGEALVPRQFQALRRACSRRGIGLLATGHAPLNLGGWRREVTASPREFAHLVNALAPEAPFDESDAQRLLQASGRSARDALDALYNAWEDGRPPAQAR